MRTIEIPDELFDDFIMFLGIGISMLSDYPNKQKIIEFVEKLVNDWGEENSYSDGYPK